MVVFRARQGLARYVTSAASPVPFLTEMPAHRIFWIPSQPGSWPIAGTAVLSDLVPHPGDHGGWWCWVHCAFSSRLGSASLVRLSELGYFADGERHIGKMLVKQSFSPLCFSPLLCHSSK